MRRFPRDIGLRKATACLHPQETTLLSFGGEGSRLARFSCVCEEDFGSSALLCNLIFSVMPGRFLLFILEKLSFFIGVLTLKHLGSLIQKKNEVNFIIIKCFMTSLYLML